MNVHELIERLNSDITCQYRMMCPENETSWYAQHGILISIREAKMFVELLNKMNDVKEKNIDK